MDLVARVIVKIFLCIVFVAPALWAEDSRQGEKSVQFFIKIDEQGFCGQPLEGRVLALDSYGLIARGYQGEKNAVFTALEKGGKVRQSLSALPRALKFQEGQAVFSLSDSEPEVLELGVKVEGVGAPLNAEVTFRKKVEPEELAIEIAPRAIIGQNLAARVLVVDKSGNIAADYALKGAILKVQERGDADLSYTISPRDNLDISAGTAKFSISDSQAEKLFITVSDPSGKLVTAGAPVEFFVPDNDPPFVSTVKMETLAFVELIFNEELEDASASDVNNYQVVSFTTKRPRSVEFRGNRAILELDDLLRPHDDMYVELKNIKDLSGNSVATSAQSPRYAVPSLPLHIELRPNSATAGINTVVTVALEVRCISGRVPQFINAPFTLTVSEATPDNSARLNNFQVAMNRGKGEFSITDTAAEKVRIIVNDPDNAVTAADVEIEFR